MMGGRYEGRLSQGDFDFPMPHLPCSSKRPYESDLTMVENDFVERSSNSIDCGVVLVGTRQGRRED